MFNCIANASNRMEFQIHFQAEPTQSNTLEVQEEGTNTIK